MVKPYKYRVQRIAPPEYNHQTVLRVGDKEVLSGTVQGMNASDLEERVAKALDKLEVDYGFRVRLTSEALGARRLTREFANMRGEIEMDFLADRSGRTYPIFVDGQISHYYTAWQIDVDKAKTNAVNEFGSRLGWSEAVRIPFWKLTNQEAADKTIRDLIL
jgi:hypothetical protein